MFESSAFVGNQVVYLYPDFETVMVGTFQNEIMISAKDAKLKAFKLDLSTSEKHQTTKN